ncbi:MAG: DUF2845 domain-containing protein [Thermodesulfobacteriota bacterium]
MKIIKIVAALFIGLLVTPPEVFALRCGSKLVAIGDRKIEVFQKCGEPTLIEKWKIENTTFKTRRNKQYSTDIIADREDKQEIKTEYVEDWTYNFGANRLIHFLTFKNGKLSQIEIGSRGFAGEFPSDFDKTRCGKLVALEDRKIDVIMKCGEPVFVETRMEEKLTSKSLSKQIGDGLRLIDENKGSYIGGQKIDIKQPTSYHEKKLFMNITDWNFNFGPHHFLQFITFENGKVTKIEHGDYGYE